MEDASCAVMFEIKQIEGQERTGVYKTDKLRCES